MLAAERGAARLTLAAYRNDLIDLAGFLAARGTALEAADAEALHAYLAMATGRLTPRSLARHISAMRQFYKFLVIDGVRQDDPSSGLDTPRSGRPLPKVFLEGEVEQLIAAARNTPGAEGVRLLCIVELLYASGLRVSELVGLPLAAALRDPRSSADPRQGRQGARCAAERTRPSRARRNISPAVTGFCRRRGASRWLFPSRGESGHLTRQRCGQLAQGSGGGRRDRPRSAVAACAAPRLSPAICSTTAPICAACS